MTKVIKDILNDFQESLTDVFTRTNNSCKNIYKKIGNFFTIPITPKRNFWNFFNKHETYPPIED